MRRSCVAIVVFCGLAVVGCLAIVRSKTVPLGVPGEWVWSRVKFSAAPLDVLLAAAGLLAYAIFAAIGAAALRGKPTRSHERLWVGLLFLAAVSVQIAIQSGGPVGHGSMKTVSLAMKGSSGYFGVARTQMADPWRFWANYPEWIRGQDALHIGTHPPGLFLASRGLLGLMRTCPNVESLVAWCVPAAANRAFRFMIPEPIPRADRSAMALMAFLTLMACSATVVPLYTLGRTSLSAETSWMAAVMWPLVPSAILFQPTADTAFPLLGCSALACAAGGGFKRAALAGTALAIGMQLTLAFLPVGLVVAIVHAARRDLKWSRRLSLILGTGVGFLGVTAALWALSGANPLDIWWSNVKNHGRFYAENPRSYQTWVIANVVEFAVAIGLPTAILAGIAAAAGRMPTASMATVAVLMLLDLSGKNLSEVGRLWILFMPPVVLAAGSGFSQLQAGPRTLAALLILLGCQTLGLQCLIQVVHAVE